MRRFLTTIIAGAIVAGGLVSCASATKSLQRGNYAEAVSLAISKLRSSPTDKKASDALVAAYPLAQEVALREINAALGSKTLAGIDRSIALYSQLNAMANDIRRAPAALALITPVDYITEQQQLQESAAEIFYDAGIKAMAYNTLEQSRVAYQNFLKVQAYRPDYRDVITKLEQARYAATMRVVVLPPIINRQYQFSADNLYLRLIADVQRRKWNNLVSFLTPEQADQMRDKPHQYLVLDLAVFTIGNTNTTQNTEEFKRDSVIIGTTTVNGKQQNVYGTVKAKLTVTKMEIISEGVMSVKIIDAATNSVLRYKNLPGRSVWSAQWGSFNGDERALTSAQLKIANNKPATPPSPQIIFDSFVEPLFGQATSYISTQY